MSILIFSYLFINKTKGFFNLLFVLKMSSEDQLNNSLASDKYSPRHIKVEASPPKGVKGIDLDKMEA